MKYLLRQVGLYLLAAWASLTLNFILPRAMPGDPVTALVARMRGRIRPEEIEAIKAAYGFTNAPILQQYFQYLSHALRGDFGISISSYPAKVSSVISTGFMWTILLGVVTLLTSFVLGTILGVFIAWRRNGFLDLTLPGLSGFIGSFPYFWLAMVALFFMGFELDWFPMSHAYSDYLSPGFTWAYIGSVIYHIVLPAGTIILVSVGGWMMGMRCTMISVLNEDYIIMAEAKGLSQTHRDVQVCHAQCDPAKYHPVWNVHWLCGCRSTLDRDGLFLSGVGLLPGAVCHHARLSPHASVIPDDYIGSTGSELPCGYFICST